MTRRALYGFLIALVLVSLSPRSWAAADDQPAKIDAKTVEISNEAMMGIFQDILKAKDQYPELKDFSKRALSRNKRGIYQIQYEYSGKSSGAASEPYAFGVTIDGIEDATFKPHRGAFYFGFPRLGVKFDGYQNPYLTRHEYDLLPAIQRRGIALDRYQQSLLPLQLTIKPVKQVYWTNEDIEFDVVLTNASKRNMIVKDLGQGTLYFLINNEYWGTTPESGARWGKNVVLMAGDSISRRFKGESFQFPTNIEILCIYRLSIDGINPSAFFDLKVVNQP